MSDNGNRNGVDQALLLLRDGLRPFAQRQLERCYGSAWSAEVRGTIDPRGQRTDEDGTFDVFDLLNDVFALLKLIDRLWQPVFEGVLDRKRSHLAPPRCLVKEMLAFRNGWAHQKPFSPDDRYRVVESVCRLLTIIGAPEAQRAHDLKFEARQELYDEHIRELGESVAVGSPEQDSDEIEEQLFRLERDFFYDRGLQRMDWPARLKEYQPLVERDRLRRELAMRLNGAPVQFSAADELFLIGAPVPAQNIVRPAIAADGMGSLVFTLSLGGRPLQKLDGSPWTCEFAAPVRNELNPLGLLYPRWQCPYGGVEDFLVDVTVAGLFHYPKWPNLSQDCAGEELAPTIILEHPRPGVWIATTLPATLRHEELRLGRETFIYDDTSRLWHRSFEGRNIHPGDLLVREYAADAPLTTREMNGSLNEWLDHWLPIIDETC